MNDTHSILICLLLNFLLATGAASQPQALVDDVLYPLAVEKGADAALARFQSLQQTSDVAGPAVLNTLGYPCCKPAARKARPKYLRPTSSSIRLT